MYSIQGGNNLATMSHITAYKVLFIGEDIFKKCHFETSYGEEQKSFYHSVLVSYQSEFQGKSFLTIPF